MLLRLEKEEQCQKESAERKPEKDAREERDEKQIEEDKLNTYFNNLKINISLLKYVTKKIINTSLFGYSY